MRVLIAMLLFIVAIVGLSPRGPVNIYYRETLAYLGLRPEATVIFGGDMQFDRYIRRVSDTRGGDYVFSCVDDTLTSADAVVANLEGPITNDPSVSEGTEAGTPDNFRFTFPADTAMRLAKHRISFVDIGNNHILNYGYTGAASTTHYLSAAGIGYFGEPRGYSVASSTVGGVPLAFISYNEFAADGSIASRKRALAQIAHAREDGFVPVVFAHWGEEYSEVLPWMRDLAHAFVDAGATLVVGAHPHIVLEDETYHGASIYYSLGNFIFDQYWNDAVTHGLLLKVTFTKDSVADIKEIPVELEKDGRTCATSSAPVSSS